METAKNIRDNACLKLKENGIQGSEATIEADILMEHIFKLKVKDIIIDPERKLPCDKVEKFNLLIERRIKEKIPVQYLTNTAYFMGCEFYVNENVLIPRPETEILLEEVIKLVSSDFTDNEELSIIDVGTGSGCIACMLAKYLHNVQITASDISEKALETAKINAEKLNVASKIDFRLSDIFSNIEGKFNLIVSNPPYISIKERGNLQFEVSGHEPHLALFTDDKKGLDFYRKLISQSRSKLANEGYLAFEIGFSQSEPVKKIILGHGFQELKIIKDYNNIERVVIAKIYTDMYL